MSTMRRAALLLAALVVGAGCSGTGDPASPVVQEDTQLGQEAIFADSSLQSAVQLALGDEAATLSLARLLGLTQLEASDRGIGDLEGIEHLGNLQSLDLASNQIDDISPLAALTGLRMLDLANNAVTDLAPLGELPGLQVLVLDGNPIESLAVLLEAPALTSLDVQGITGEVPLLDGQVAALRERGVEVYERPLEVEAEPPPEEVELPRPIVPDNQIVFISRRSGKGPAMYVMDADAPDPVSQLNTWRAESVSLSPDRSRLAFQTNSPLKLLVADADGGNVKALTGMTGMSGASWSPDGARLVYGGFEMTGNSVSSALYTIELDSRLITRITEFAERGEAFHQPSWSPDGARIACTTGQYGSRDICVMDVDGSGVVNLTQHSEEDYSPAWSPDGTRIAFTSNRDGNPQIYVMDPDGGDLVSLTQHPDDGYDPTWSPDGSRIAFVSDRDTNQEIYVMNADGSHPVRLTRHVSFDCAPSWSAW